MFTSFALLLPFWICVLGTFLFIVKRHKDLTQRFILALNILCMLYFCADSILLYGEQDSVQGIVSSILRQFVGPTLLPLLLLFLRSMRKTSTLPWTTGFWFIPPVAFGSVSLVLLFLMGRENAGDYLATCIGMDGVKERFVGSPLHEVHFLFDHTIYKFFMLAELIYVTVWILYQMYRSEYTLRSIYHRLLHNDHVPVCELLYPSVLLFLFFTGIRLGLGRELLHHHLSLTGFFNVMMSACIALVDYLSLYTNRSPVTFRVLRSPLSMADSGRKYHYQVEKGKVDTPIEGMNALSYAELVDGFKALMMVDRLYLNPNLCLEDVVEKLNSNRTYVSCMVSKEYGMNFRDYIGSLRIEAATKYMKAHPTATQTEVAIESGFSSASAFNKKFRQVKGTSPRQWQLS